VALESLDEPASLEFRTLLHTRLVAELGQDPTSAASQTVMTEVIDRDDVEGDPVVGPSTTRPHRTSRAQLVLGIAAAIAVIAALAAVIAGRRPDPAVVDTSHDGEIATAALIPPTELGSGWRIQSAYTAFTSRVAAEVAATVPSCAAYVADAFDSPGRNAVTAERKFANPITTTMYQWVYVFPTQEQATRVMDKLSESAFQTCFTGFYEASVPVQDPRYKVTMTLADTPRLRAHGERQIAFATAQKFEGPGLNGPRTLTTVNTYIQVGRAIAFVDPIRNVHDEPDSPMERAMTAAANALTVALKASPDRHG
jgi:hypothetical protein